MSELAVSALPEILVKVNERLVPQEQLTGLVEILVQQHLGLPTMCELAFRQPRGPLEPIMAWEPGNTVWVGFKDERDTLFAGEITAMEHIYGADDVRELYIRAYDRLHRLRKRQTVRMWSDISLQRLAREIVGDIGLNASVPVTTSLRWERLYQVEQNDFDLLTARAAEAGLHPFLQDGTVEFMTLAGRGSPIKLELGHALSEATVELNAEAVASQVEVTGWNRREVAMLRATARQPRSGRDVRLKVSSEEVGGQSTRYLLNEAASRQEQLEARAQADLDYRHATGIHLRGSAAGNPALQPGVRVAIAGLDRQINGHYVLSQVTHSLTADEGYGVQFSSEPPELPQQSPRDITTYGVVTSSADPKRYGRIQARLPAYNDLETDWMPILMPGAGSGKGFVALPDKGDLIIVVLHDGDPGQALALGNVFGNKQIPDTGRSYGAVREFSWVSPGGQQIQLDDVGNKIRLENDSGAFIELAGSQITIVGNRIDFRRINLAEQALAEAEQGAQLSQEIKEDMSRWLQEQNQKGRLVVVLLAGLAVLALLALLIFFLVQTIGQGG